MILRSQGALRHPLFYKSRKSLADFFFSSEFVKPANCILPYALISRLNCLDVFFNKQEIKLLTRILYLSLIHI